MMNMRVWLAAGLAVAGLGALPGFAQAPQKLTRADAEAMALQNHPGLRSALLRSEAARQVVSEVRSAYAPLVLGSLSGAEAEHGSRIAAGGLNNPIIFSRFAYGMTVSQLVSDFGRTGSLSQAAQFQAESQQEGARAARADVLLRVDVAYYRALRAIAVQRVAEQTLQARQLVAEQVAVLTKNKLKSGLDLSFANVNLSEAKLLALEARNAVDAAFAELSAAMGFTEQHTYELVEEPLPPAPLAELASLIQEAFRQRPELVGRRFTRDSARAFARAERDLWFPTISAVGGAGLIPYRQEGLTSRYAAAGFNVQVPLFNGQLFTARHSEANLRAQAAEQDVRELEDRISQDVRLAWLNANAAFQRLDLTGELLREATDALSLAQARYNLGLSSIIELSQAQLNQTQGEIEQASAKYEYQIDIVTLHYQMGLR